MTRRSSEKRAYKAPHTRRDLSPGGAATSSPAVRNALAWPANHPDALCSPLCALSCVIPPTSEDDLLAGQEVPHASFASSSQSSIASMKISSGQPSQSESTAGVSRDGKVGQPTSPPPGRPQVRPYSSTESLSASSASLSSVEDSSKGSRSLPISIPTSPNKPTSHRTVHPPITPPLSPIIVPESQAMQMLSLDPAGSADMPRSESSERLFRISVDGSVKNLGRGA